MFSPFDHQMMTRCLQLAATRKGFTSPNPVVASVIVKEGQIVGEGVHESAGTLHAEPRALHAAGDRAEGGTLYVNLEPCTHWGKTPPCAEAIIQKKISRVIYAVDDPFYLVRKKSAKKVLGEAGILTQSGLLADQAWLLNAEFFKNKIFNQPFVVLKAGMSLDGRIALSNGESKYITGPQSLEMVHRIRKQVRGILIGINTVLADDPSLTVRYGLDRDISYQPTRIILDSQLRISESASLFHQDAGEVIIVTEASEQMTIRAREFRSRALIWQFPSLKTSDFWKQLLERLYQHGITSLLIEGGSQIFSSAMDHQIVDQVHFFIAPKLLLGKDSVPVIAGKEVASLAHAVTLSHRETQLLGDDVLVSGYTRNPMDYRPRSADLPVANPLL